MRLHTASEIISLARKLESESAKFYRELAQKYADKDDVFTLMAKENEAYIVQIERAYYGVITDAIEGGFAFDMESDDYTLDISPGRDASYSDALHKAISLEEMIIRFYTDAAGQSDTLMADVPLAFRQVVKKREARLMKLKQLI
jgi:hypothetical protein